MAASVLATGLVAAALTGCGGHAKPKASKPPVRSTTSTTVHKARPHKKRKHALVAHAPVCPLTGLTPKDGKVPQRAAVAVKVENLPQARPQYGLDQADIVFEEPVEGGITRFIAVYQCQSAARIEPVRSARLVDAQILEPLGHLLFAYSGAIQAVIDEVDSPGSLLDDVGGNQAPNAYWRDPTRYAPHNLETSTAALYSAANTLHYPENPPTPIFTYGPMAKGATPASKVSIDYPLDVTTWTWHPHARRWYRFYSDTGLAMQGDNVQISAANVVVMMVDEYPTQYVEDANGAYENELVLTGHGPAWVFRDGAQYYGKWVRPSLSQPAYFVETDGTRVTLSPGNTWVELVPDGRQLSVRP